MNIDTQTIAAQISAIIEGRKSRAQALRDAQASMSGTRTALLRLSQQIESAQADLTDQDAASNSRVEDAKRFCKEAIAAIGRIRANAQTAYDDCKVKLDHFERAMFCVGFAGGTQAGKTTTLQKIVGMDEKNDPTCPIIGGGQGESTTATRCRVVNIEADQRPHAKVFFFTPDEFIKNSVHPYVRALASADLHLPYFASLEDFEAFDADAFETERRDEIEEKLGNRQSVRQYLARFLTLRKRLDDYRRLLEGESELDIPLEKAHEYLVYPSAKSAFRGLPYKCNAVREVVLFCHYPNPVVAQSEYIDLPGAGEIAPDVQKRYAEGFTLASDAILFVSAFDQKPYQEQDVEMVDTLCDVVPPGQLDNFMIYFQNDFHQVDGLDVKLRRAARINKGTKYPVFAIVGRTPDLAVFRLDPGADDAPSDPNACRVAEIGPAGRVVIFGEGNDPVYVTQTLVPLVCAVAAQRLPSLDAALSKESSLACSKVLDAAQRVRDDLSTALKRILAGLPEKEHRHVNEVTKRVRSLRVAFDAIRRSLREDYDSRKLLAPTSSDNTPAGIQKALLTEIDAPDSGLLLCPDKESLLRELRQASAQATGIGGELERDVRNLRVSVTERFASLEGVYDEAISDLVDTVFQRLRDANDPDAGFGLPFLSKDASKSYLQDWIARLDAAGCPTLRAAAEDLSALRIQFYLAVYPDVRKAVFGRTDNQVCVEEFAGSEKPEQLYEMLRDIAHDWGRDTGTCIAGRNVAREIVFSAFERFFDRTLSSPESDDELNVFVSCYWPLLAGEADPSERFRGRFAALLRHVEAAELSGAAQPL